MTVNIARSVEESEQQLELGRAVGTGDEFDEEDETAVEPTKLFKPDAAVPPEAEAQDLADHDTATPLETETEVNPGAVSSDETTGL